jgi:putative membrane protein
MFLSQSEVAAIDGSIARVEARTGVQIVAAIVGKADSHAELPWIAFALGVSLAALGFVIADWLRPDWISGQVALAHTLTIMGVGGASTLAAVFVPAYARLFLRPALRDLEVRHYAESLFLRRELFKTRDRNGILLLVCRFERKVEILADLGFHGRMGEADWDRVIAAMKPLLREARFVDAVHAGLALLEQVLSAKGFAGVPGSANELPDRPIEERGA